MKKFGKQRSVLRNYIATYFLVFAIPLVLFSFMIYKQTLIKSSKDYIATVDAAAQGVCTNLTRLYDLSAANANFTRENQYYSAPFIRDFAGSFVYIDKNMQNLNSINKDFTQLAFYSAQSDLVYSGSIYSKTFYFSKIFVSPLFNNGTAFSEIGLSTWIPMHKVSFEGNETLVATIVHPVHRIVRSNQKITKSLLFSHLGEKEMLQLLSPITAISGANAIVLWDGKPIFSNNYELMQEYIALDKKLEQSEAVTLWGEPYITRLTATQDNISIISFLPQKITHALAQDVMLIYILSLTLSVAVAAILIYFSIRHNYRPVVELLRKAVKEIALPSNAKNLNEMEQTAYAFDNIIQNKRLIEVDNKQFKLNHLLVRLSENSATYIRQPSFARRRAELELNLEAKHYCCIIFRRCVDRDSLMHTLLQCSKQNDMQMYPAIDLEESTAMALVCAENADTNAILALLEGIEDMYGVAGIGSFVNSLEQVSVSYKQAYHALLHIDSTQRIYCFSNTQQADKSDVLTQFAKEADLFSNAIIQRRQNQMRLSLSRISDLLEMIPSDSSYPVLMHHVQFVAVKALAAANLPFNTTIDVFSKLPSGEILTETQSWIASLSAHLASLISRGELVSEDTGDTSQKGKMVRSDIAKDMQYILLYINSSYMKIDFSIKSLADELGISVSNLSHFFKSRHGQNLSDYIGDLRIAEAKRLLCETSLSITEIVPRLGYTHISSFTKTFKKATGITPTEYKAQSAKGKAHPINTSF